MIKRTQLLIATIFFINTLQAQMHIKINTTPQYFTPLLDSIFIAGSFNDWQAGDTVYVLHKDADNTYAIDLNGTDGDAIEFKFTRGDWARVEVNSAGDDIENRLATFINGDTLYCEVENWHDETGTHTIAGNVIQLDYNFFIPQLNRSRRIWIYLPSEYFSSDEHYPVIYMHDGQNVFDNATSFAGEWDVDNTMQTIFSLTHSSAIVVAVANGEYDRIDEYSPWVNATYGGGDGDAYAAFIVNTLKPYIDTHYRSLPDREHTVIGGSSLGALISYYMVLQYDSVFGKAILMSPSFWFADSVNVFANDYIKNYPCKIYITAGQYEDVDMVPDINTVVNSLKDDGFTDDEIISVIRSDGAHSEWFWKREYDDAYYWLFGIEAPVDIQNIHDQPCGYYDFVNHIFHIKNNTAEYYTVYDIQGKKVAEHAIISTNIDFAYLQTGIYIIKVYTNTICTTQKIILL